MQIGITSPDLHELVAGSELLPKMNKIFYMVINILQL